MITKKNQSPKKLGLFYLIYDLQMNTIYGRVISIFEFKNDAPTIKFNKLTGSFGIGYSY